jgi:hypothetical protein
MTVCTLSVCVCVRNSKQCGVAGVFVMLEQRGMVRTLRSFAHTKLHLALDGGIVQSQVISTSLKLLKIKVGNNVVNMFRLSYTHGREHYLLLLLTFYRIKILVSFQKLLNVDYSRGISGIKFK